MSAPAPREASPTLVGGGLAAVASGLLLAACFPPVDAGPLAFVALVGLLWSWQRDGSGPGRAALYGFASGVACFGAVLSWAWYLGAVAFVPLVLAETAYWAGAGAVVGWLRTRGLRSPFLVAAVWVAMEAVQTRWPLGGLAWAQVGVTLHDVPFARALAGVGGVPLVSFAVVAVNALLLDAARAVVIRPGRRRALLAAGAGLVGVALVLGTIVVTRFVHSPSTRLRFALLQGNDQDRRLTQAEIDADYLTRKHLALARRLHGRYDLIVFPESALEDDPEAEPALRDQIVAIGREHHSAVLVNVVDLQTPGKRYNANRLYTPSGRLAGTYAKQHLVPFGEYVPLSGLRSVIPQLHQVPNDYDAGHRTVLFRVRGVPIGTVICFESAFGPLVRDFVRDGARLLVVSTNNRSYRRSANSAQHLALGQMRAAETARPVLQASISGISGVIDASGNLSHTTRLFERAIVSGTITTTTGQTPYVRFGDWVEWGSGAALAGIALTSLAGRRLGSRTRAARPAGRAARPSEPVSVSR